MPIVERWFLLLNPATVDLIIPLQDRLSQPCADINCFKKKNCHLLSRSTKSIGCLRLNSQPSSKFSSLQTHAPVSPHSGLLRLSADWKEGSKAFYLITRTHYRFTANQRPKISKGELPPPAADMFINPKKKKKKTTSTLNRDPSFSEPHQLGHWGKKYWQ